MFEQPCAGFTIKTLVIANPVFYLTRSDITGRLKVFVRHLWYTKEVDGYWHYSRLPPTIQPRLPLEANDLQARFNRLPHVTKLQIWHPCIPLDAFIHEQIFVKKSVFFSIIQTHLNI